MNATVNQTDADFAQAAALYTVHFDIGNDSRDETKGNKNDSLRSLGRYAEYRNAGGLEPTVVIDGFRHEGDILFFDLVDFYEFVYGPYSGRSLKNLKPWLGMGKEQFEKMARSNQLESGRKNRLGR